MISDGCQSALRTAAVRRLSLAELQGSCALPALSDVEYHAQEPVGLMRTGWNLGGGAKRGGDG